MGRQKRPYAPGMIFHLVSRTHRREPLFSPDLRAEVASLIQWMVGRTDAQLLAYVVMPNHLHLILRQGRSELSAVMQPLLRRVAHRVQRRHDFEGVAFERRFRDQPCRTADHVREALIYAHLNPWRAGLCGADLAYPWMTQQAYLPGADPARFGIDPHVQLQVLELFAGHGRHSRDEFCQDYSRWLQWRIDKDRARDATVRRSSSPETNPPPAAPGGEDAWRRHFAPAVRYDFEGGRKSVPDLRDYIAGQLPRVAPGCTAEDLRGSFLPRSVARYRARLIRSAAERGYSTGDLARYFHISPTTVSTAKYAAGEKCS